MKLKSATLRTYTTLHTWVGLVAGFALFVAFYAGAITVFHHELQFWQSPHAVERPQDTLAEATRRADEALYVAKRNGRNGFAISPAEELPLRRRSNG